MNSRGRKKTEYLRRAYYSPQEPVTGQEEGAFPAEGGMGRTYCIMAPTALRQEPVPPRERPADPAPPAEERERTVTLGGVARVAAGLLLAAVIITSPLWLTGEDMLPVMKQLSAASASVQLPLQSVSQSDAPTAESTAETVQTTAAPTAASTAATTPPTEQDTHGLLPVKEQKVGNSGTRVGDIYVKNSTGYTPDFEALIKNKADCRIKLNAGYQVLIVHTHTTEGYARRTDGLYSPDYSPRTTDSQCNMTAVGKVLKERLEQAGIRTLHATEVHDHPQYNGSYDRAKTTIEKYLREHPSIEMVLDVHRDAITYEDGTKLKPTAEINGRKAAQVMIISGCDAGGKLYFPGWKSNLTMALQLQQRADGDNRGLMRPLSFAPYRYNMHLTPNSLLLEFGTDANTLEEALFSAELLGDSLASLLLEYDVAKK